MRFLPYLTLLLSFVIGYLGSPIFYVLLVAIVSALLVFPNRRNQLRNQPQAPDRNMILDGGFLVFQQILIHFVAFALGVFLMRILAAG